MILLCGAALGVASLLGTAYLRPTAFGTGPGQDARSANDALPSARYARNPAAPLNEAPAIDDLTINPARFILQCQPATIVLAAHDPESADLAFDWTIVSGPPGATLTPAGAAATFASTAAASYQLRVTASDPSGATASQEFAVQVLAGGAICPLALAAD